jgi:hypothetical protein
MEIRRVILERKPVAHERQHAPAPDEKDAESFQMSFQLFHTGFSKDIMGEPEYLEFVRRRQFLGAAVLKLLF